MKTPDEGTTTFSPKEYSHFKFNTPIAPPADPAQRAKLVPGTCVKTREDFCGIVHKHSQDDPRECIVIGHGWSNEPNEKFIWRGTLAEFNRTWSID